MLVPPRDSQDSQLQRRLYVLPGAVALSPIRLARALARQQWCFCFAGHRQSVGLLSYSHSGIHAVHQQATRVRTYILGALIAIVSWCLARSGTGTCKVLNVFYYFCFLLWPAVNQLRFGCTDVKRRSCSDMIVKEVDRVQKEKKPIGSSAWSNPVGILRSRYQKRTWLIQIQSKLGVFNGVEFMIHICEIGTTRWLKRNTGNEYLIQERSRHKSGKVRCKSPDLAVMVFMGNSRLRDTLPTKG